MGAAESSGLLGCPRDGVPWATHQTQAVQQAQAELAPHRRVQWLSCWGSEMDTDSYSQHREGWGRAPASLSDTATSQWQCRKSLLSTDFSLASTLCSNSQTKMFGRRMKAKMERVSGTPRIRLPNRCQFISGDHIKVFLEPVLPHEWSLKRLIRKASCLLMLCGHQEKIIIISAGESVLSKWPPEEITISKNRQIHPLHLLSPRATTDMNVNSWDESAKRMRI